MAPSKETKTPANANEHTPTPWSLDKGGLIMGPDGKHSIHSVIDDVCISKEDAAFIVRAVNAHEDLLATLANALHELRSVNANEFIIQQCEKTLAQSGKVG